MLPGADPYLSPTTSLPSFPNTGSRDQRSHCQAKQKWPLAGHIKGQRTWALLGAPFSAPNWHAPSSACGPRKLGLFVAPRLQPDARLKPNLGTRYPISRLLPSGAVRAEAGLRRTADSARTHHSQTFFPWGEKFQAEAELQQLARGPDWLFQTKAKHQNPQRDVCSAPQRGRNRRRVARLSFGCLFEGGPRWEPESGFLLPQVSSIPHCSLNHQSHTLRLLKGRFAVSLHG